MALTYDDITSKVQLHIIPRLIDTVYLSSPIFTRIRTKCAERFEGGVKIGQPVAYAELHGGPYARGGTFDVSYVPTDTLLTVVPKFFHRRNSAWLCGVVLNKLRELLESLENACTTTWPEMATVKV